MPEFKREHRYIILKLSDVEQASLGTVERAALDRIICIVDAARKYRDKPPLECVVVESDWPEYEPTWKAIKRRMSKAAPMTAASGMDEREG